MDAFQETYNYLTQKITHRIPRAWAKPRAGNVFIKFVPVSLLDYIFKSSKLIVPKSTRSMIFVSL